MAKHNGDGLMMAAAGVGGLLAARALCNWWREYDLRGRVVLITGGSRGLGLVMAREFAREGARLALCARDVDELERARADLMKRGAEVFVFPCDVTEKAQVCEWIEVGHDHYGRDRLVCKKAWVVS